MPASATLRRLCSLAISVPPTMPVPRKDAVDSKNGGTRACAKVGEHSPVRVHPALRVGAEADVEDAEWLGRVAERRTISASDRSRTR